LVKNHNNRCIRCKWTDNIDKFL